MSATMTVVPWPARADIAPALAEVERFIEDLEAGVYRDLPDDFEVVGRLTALAQGFEVDAAFIEDLRDKIVTGFIEPIVGDLELLPLGRAR